MPFRILFVCTGNICRSPTAERILRQRLQARRPDLPGAFVVSSAGTGALVGEPIQQHAAALLREAGVDTSDFAARLLTAEQIEDADLVLAMTRRHRSDCAALVPDAVSRTFTLREFARLASAAAGERPSASDAEQHARAMIAAAAGKRGTVRPDCPGDDDVGDPYGGPAAGYRKPYEVIAAACATVAEILAPDVR